MVAGFKSCAIQGCARNAHRKLGGSRGWCQAHYKRWRRYGDPVGGRAPNGDPEQFFQMALEYDGDDCIQWPYSRTKTGYARIWVGDRMRIASRLICQAVYGAAPTPKHHAAHEMRGMVGELTDTQESAGPAPDFTSLAPREADESEQDDVGATASSTNSATAHKPAGDLAADNGDKDRGSFPVGGPVHSNSPAAIPLGAANSVGEAPSSSPASPARHSDEDIPAFLKRDEGRGYPKREAEAV